MSGTFGTESLVQLKFGAFQPVVNNKRNNQQRKHETKIIWYDADWYINIIVNVMKIFYNIFLKKFFIWLKWLYSTEKNVIFFLYKYEIY